MIGIHALTAGCQTLQFEFTFDKTVKCREALQSIDYYYLSILCCCQIEHRQRYAHYATLDQFRLFVLWPYKITLKFGIKDAASFVNSNDNVRYGTSLIADKY